MRSAAVCSLLCVPLALAQSQSQPSGPAQAAAQTEPGVSMKLFDVGRPMSALMPVVAGQKPNVWKVISRVDLSGQRDDFAPLKDQFITELTGFLNITFADTVTFRLTSDDGSKLWVDGRLQIDNDGLHGAVPRQAAMVLGVGAHPFRIEHFDAGGDKELKLEWLRETLDPGGEFTVIPDTAFSCPKQPRPTAPGHKQVVLPPPFGRPGDRLPLNRMNPGWDVTRLGGEDLRGDVTGLALLPQDRLAVCLAGNPGAVQIIAPLVGPPESATATRFAAGLDEPRGLVFANDNLYVLQRPELTLLADSNRDGAADEFHTACGNWPMTPAPNELAAGLAFRDGAFFAGLGVALQPDGHTSAAQIYGRGTIIRIDEQGAYEYFAGGLRTPGGLAFDRNGALLATDSAGDWAPAPRIVQVERGAFFGVHTNPAGPFDDRPAAPPAVWLPAGEIAVRPAQLALIPGSSYVGQFMLADPGYGNILRVFLENIDGRLQGGVVRFAAGLPGAPAALAWSPFGVLYVGTVGVDTPAGHVDGGVFRLTANGKSPPTIHSVRAMTNGLEIALSAPLAEKELGWAGTPVASAAGTGADDPGGADAAQHDGKVDTAHHSDGASHQSASSAAALPVGPQGWDPAWYLVRQWRYESTEEFGGPQLDLERLPVKSATVSDDRRTIFLEIDGLKAGRVVYVRLAGPFVAEDGSPLWTTEAWYTLNAIPSGRPGTPRPAPAGPAPNTLSDAEQAAGWTLLFDGRSTAGWRGFRKDALPAGWQVEQGCLTRVGPDAGDIVTTGEYQDFELALEWRISEGGNSGIFFHVTEDHAAPYETGPEMQVLDNERHADGARLLTSAGADYGLHAAPYDLTVPAGGFNRARILVHGHHVEYWLNGTKTADYELLSPQWESLVAGSKFSSMPRFGREPRGHISLQDHGDKVWFRNIKLRRL